MTNHNLAETAVLILIQVSTPLDNTSSLQIVKQKLTSNFLTSNVNYRPFRGILESL